MQSLNEISEQTSGIIIIAVDETQYWSDDITAKSGRILTKYMVNMGEPTQLCEPAISFPATALENIVENSQNFTEDELHEIEHTNIGGEVTYLKGSNRYDVVKTYEDMTEEEVEEYESANPTYIPV